MAEEERGELSTEVGSERFRDLDSWDLRRSLTELVASNGRAVEAVERALPQLEEAAGAVAERLMGGGRLIYAGAGTSGRLALQDAAELPPTFGFDRTVVLLAGGMGAGASALEGAEDDEEAAAGEVRSANVSSADALVAIAASGRTPYTVAALREATERGAVTVGIANNPRTPLLEAAMFPVCLDTGPEVLAGSTRLAAGTAQKIALNAISTAVLVRLGGAYRNLMVGMSQSNEKLRRRAVKIVASAARTGEAEARAALEHAGGSIRLAIVCLLAGLEVDEARRLLEAHGNRVREALEEVGVMTE